MIEKFLGDARLIKIQQANAISEANLGEYSIYNSTIDEYMRKLTVPKRESPFERIAKYKGTVLDIGYSIPMLISLKKGHPDVNCMGIGIYVNQYELKLAREHHIGLIEGSFFNPPQSLQELEKKCQTIVSKNTFSVIHNLNILPALQYVWDLLSFDQDMSKTGIAYIHIHDPKIYDTKAKEQISFSALCDRMTNLGFIMIFSEIQYDGGIVMITKSKPDPMQIPFRQVNS